VVLREEPGRGAARVPGGLLGLQRAAGAARPAALRGLEAAAAGEAEEAPLGRGAPGPREQRVEEQEGLTSMGENDMMIYI